MSIFLAGSFLTKEKTWLAHRGLDSAQEKAVLVV